MSEAARQIAAHDEHQVATSGSADEAFIQMVERAAANPAVDVEKLERLLTMRERIDSRLAEEAFNEAMNAAQSEMHPISADATNPQTRSKYASYAALDRALRPIYTRHGFSLSFDTGDGAPADHVRVLCYVARGRYTRTYRADMPADGKGAKGGDVMTKTHATGSAYSYGSRYLLKNIFNVAVGEYDDDGNGAGGDPTTLSSAQITALRAAIVEVGIDISKVTAYAKVDRIEDIPARHFDKVLGAVKQKAKP